MATVGGGGLQQQHSDETTSDDENGFRLQLLRGKLEDTLRQKFHNHYPKNPKLLYYEFQKMTGQINTLRQKKRISKNQYELILPPNGCFVYSDKFDATLLMLLIFEFCGYQLPSPHWKPKSNDRTDRANFVRVREGRNRIQHEPPSVPKQVFLNILYFLEQPLIDLGTSKIDLDRIKTMKIIDDQTKTRIINYEQSKMSFNYNYMPPVCNFFSRDGVIRHVHSRLTRPNQPNLNGTSIGTVLYGMGGVGKSETARQYWKIYSKTYYEDSILWINGKNQTTMEKAFKEISDRCGLRKTKNSDGTFKQISEIAYWVYVHFSSKKVLFVFDNIPDQKDIQPFLPTSSNIAPHLLITSQCSHWDNRFDTILLKTFSQEEALQFLKENTTLQQHQNDESNISLLSSLGYHPLALQQVTAYLKKNSMSVSEYVSLFNDRKADLLSEATNELGHPSILATLSLSLENLEETENVEKALFLLKIMTYLDGKDIQKGILIQFCNNDLYVLNKALSVLQKYSFINVEAGNAGKSVYEKTVTIHSIIQHILDIKCKQKGEVDKTIEIIMVQFLYDLDRNRKKDGRFWFHHFLHLCENEEIKFSALRHLQTYDLDNILNLFKTNGYIPRLKTMFEYLYEQFVDTADERYITTLNYYIAGCLFSMGHIDDALVIYQDIEIVQLSFLDKNDYDYLSTKHQIGNCFYSKGLYDKALVLYQQIEKVERKTLGKFNADYLSTKHQIGNCYYGKSQYDKALEIYHKVQEAKQELDGDSDTKHQIGNCLFRKGQYDEALQIYHDVEQEQMRTLGNLHPSHLTTKHQIGNCYYSKGQHDKALEIFQIIENVSLQTLGNEHPNYLSTKHVIGNCFYSKGQYNRALEIFNEVEKMKLKTMGSSHPSYLNTKYQIANCHYAMGRHEKALEIFRNIELERSENINESQCKSKIRRKAIKNSRFCSIQ